MEIIIFITLLIIAYRSSKTIRANIEIMREFNQSSILSVLVFIYPLGPLVLFGSSIAPLAFLYVVAFACFIPQFIIARKQINILSCSGTDRVNEAKEGLSLASLGALIGLIYLSAGVIMTFAITSVGSSY